MKEYTKPHQLPVLKGDRIYEEEGNKVADIAFGYRNRLLIQALKQRGDLITKGVFKGLSEHEKKLNEIIQDEKNLIDFTTPVRAFVTFWT